MGPEEDPEKPRVSPHDNPRSVGQGDLIHRRRGSAFRLKGCGLK